MSISPDIRDQAYHFFVQEAPELLQIIETELLQLRQERTTPRVHALMRAAHSIKGGAANVGLEAIKTLAHRLEDYFRAFYNEDLHLDDQLESLLLQAYDRLRIPLMEAIQLGDAFDGEAALAAAQPVFVEIEACLGDFLGGEDQLPTVAEMGIDIAQMIFETDVTQALDRLAGLNPDDPILLGELRAQAEVFLGIAELLSFGGFQEINQLLMTALETNPHHLKDIYAVALADLRAACQSVLAGDRKQGGRASAALQQLAEADALPTNSFFNFSAAQEAEYTNLANFSLEELFDLSSPFQVDPSTADPAEAPALSLEDIFGLPTPLSQSEEGKVEAPALSLEDIFAPLPDASTPLLTEPLVEDLTAAASSETLEETRAVPVPADLSLTLNLIEQNFDRLPPVTSLPTPENPPAPTPAVTIEPTITPAPAPRSQPAPSEQLTVRLEISQLERMNNQLGELSINHNGLSLQNSQLQTAVQSLRQRFDLFLGIGGQLRTQLNKILIAPVGGASPLENRYQSVFQRPILPLPSLASRLNYGEFDSLELDRYNDISNLLQEAMECILQLEEAVGDVTLFAERSDRNLDQQKRLLTNLRDELMRARMLPLGNILNRFPRQLRDLSLQYKKPVDLHLSGTGVLVDKAVLEKLYDPLLHLVRNAFDHGIEDPQVRRQQGKPEEGRISIQAYSVGSHTLIEVRDDGGGIDLDRVLVKAVDLGLLKADIQQRPSDQQILEFLFEPGFSTASQVSELSGRGVGLDIVRAQLRALKGSISVSSKPGQGTTFTLKIPFTLGISKLMLVWTGNSTVAIPSDSIEDILNPQPQMLKQTNGQRFLLWQDQVVPIYQLQELLPYNCPVPEGSGYLSLNVIPTPEDWAPPLLLLRQGDQMLALEVERLLTEQELVIKPFSTALTAPGYCFGCTILADGSLVPVLEGTTLVARHLGQQTPSLSPQPPLPRMQQVETVLIVDDSAGMRQTLSLTLQKAGYQVLQARDGREALEQLQQQRQIQLVICDVEMPVMNGFEFLSHRRQNTELNKIPVVMLTSRGGQKHRQLALQLGATGYFTKPYIEQQFLSEVKQQIEAIVAA
uniref:histidine kinase n=1 Tax=Cyanothece sp. (strain PCC 7425 / ATCC 29141) TaxID=395961 RepID=B8HNR9_CYAP4